MNDSVNIVVQKNHEDNLNRLDIPREILPYLNVSVINMVSSKISKITDKDFQYFGVIDIIDDNTLVRLKSSDNSEITITLSHNIVYDKEGKSLGSNILFDGLCNSLDKKLEEELSKPSKVSSEDFSKVLDSIKEDTEKQKQELEDIKKGKKKKALLGVLGIEKKVVLESVEAIQLSNTLSELEKETSPVVKKEKSKKVNNFLKALENMNTTEDIKEKKRELFLNSLNKKLDKMNGNI
jgi:hypothetical protein